MKRFLLTTFLVVMLVIAVLIPMSACNEIAPPEAQPSSLIPTANNTYDIGTSTKMWQDIKACGNITGDGTTQPTIVSPVMSGTWTGAPTFSGGVTLTSPTLTGATVTTGTSTNLTITDGVLAGTMTGTGTVSGNVTFSNVPKFMNHACGIASVSDNATSATFAHGMASTPTIVLLTWNGDPESDPTLWWSATSENITATLSTALTGGSSVNISWSAYIINDNS